MRFHPTKIKKPPPWPELSTCVCLCLFRDTLFKKLLQTLSGRFSNVTVNCIRAIGKRKLDRRCHSGGQGSVYSQCKTFIIHSVLCYIKISCRELYWRILAQLTTTNTRHWRQMCCQPGSQIPLMCVCVPLSFSPFSFWASPGTCWATSEWSPWWWSWQSAGCPPLCWTIACRWLASSSWTWWSVWRGLKSQRMNS